MIKILDEVRQISSDAMAKKQDAAKNKMPDLLKQIKGAASLGKTECEFEEYAIDLYSKKLLEAEGFSVWATTKTYDPSDYKAYAQNMFGKSRSIWRVSW